jgi:hypothetical protein
MQEGVVVRKHYVVIVLFVACSFLPMQSFAPRPLIRKVSLPLPVLETQCDTPFSLEEQCPPPITIWIHGSRLFPRAVFKTSFHNQPQLKLATDIDKKYHLRQVADILIKTDPSQFHPATLYLFGWSGKISFTEREQAARILFTQLKEVALQYYNRYQKIPFIRIITHSHGGNVVLNMATLMQEEDSLCISELILLACPVQVKTMDYIKHPLFKKIYSLYSALDFIQIIDPQGLYKEHEPIPTPLFSQRRFPMHEKLSQVKIQVNGRAITHGEFVAARFLHYLPHIIQEIAQWDLQHPNPHVSHNQRTRLLCVCLK